ncbi:unnamed protein product [Caenorhabditis auriculariae]|uniref:Uncharacterized protein n=1 Tax=Caenorhabditis auriculariae TaxID=2777116 RepID=A0A8S1HLY0_9PELO|nr:unnamed protein product [Caenorhabditis auriculariae]
MGRFRSSSEIQNSDYLNKGTGCVGKAGRATSFVTDEDRPILPTLRQLLVDAEQNPGRGSPLSREDLEQVAYDDLKRLRASATAEEKRLPELLETEHAEMANLLNAEGLNYYYWFNSSFFLFLDTLDTLQT